MAFSNTVPDRIKVLPDDIATQLRSVEPSTCEGGVTLFPCEVVLDDGSVHSRVYLAEAAAYHRDWGVWPWEDRGKSWIAIERIREVRSSPLRLPARFANELNAAGESGMGYCAFSVKLKDGRRLYFVTGNAVDFPNWPEGVEPREVVGVTPGDRHPEHRHRAPRADELGASYAWSLFRE